ncbi:unnamed protein product, partial [Rotaria sp. Silwood2]
FNNCYRNNKFKIQIVTQQTTMVSNINKIRLPLALKPSNSTTLSSSLDSDETLPPTTPNTDINPTSSSAIQSSSSSAVQSSSSSTI